MKGFAIKLMMGGRAAQAASLDVAVDIDLVKFLLLSLSLPL